MKVDVLQFFPAGKAEGGKKAKAAAPGFQAALEQRLDKPKAEKKQLRPTVATTADELLLVSRAATPAAHPAPLIGTKPAALKVEPAKLGAQQLSVRAHGAAEHQRVADPMHEKKSKPAPEPKREREAKLESTRDEPKPELASAAPTAATPVITEPFKLEAPARLEEARPLAPEAPLMLDDASLRAVLLPTVARVSLETPDAGRLNVQLKVQDGVTEVRATGPAAQLLEARQGELRVALAQEGLALGHFDLSQGGHQPAERPELEQSAPTARRSAGGESTSSTVAEDGRVHVKA